MTVLVLFWLYIWSFGGNLFFLRVVWRLWSKAKCRFFIETVGSSFDKGYRGQKVKNFPCVLDVFSFQRLRRESLNLVFG